MTIKNLWIGYAIGMAVGLLMAFNLSQNMVFLWLFDPERGFIYGDALWSVALRWAAIEIVENIVTLFVGVCGILWFGLFAPKPIVWGLDRLYFGVAWIRRIVLEKNLYRKRQHAKASNSHSTS